MEWSALKARIEGGTEMRNFAHRVQATPAASYAPVGQAGSASASRKPSDTRSTRSRARRLVIITSVLGTAAVVAAAVALASEGGSGFIKLGPFALGPTISLTGSCGNVYQIVQNAETSYRLFPQKADSSYIVEQLYRSKGRTQAGSSEEACSSGSGATVATGIKISTEDQTVVRITGGTFNPAAPCSSPCFFAQFTPSFFGPAAVATPLSGVALETTACNGSVIAGGGNFAGDITGRRTSCSRDDDG
jgi:hypothetical protein